MRPLITAALAALAATALAAQQPTFRAGSGVTVSLPTIAFDKEGRISPDLEGLSALVDEVKRELSDDDRDTFDLKPLPPLERPPTGGEHKATGDSGVLERAAKWARSTLRRR